MCRKITVFFLLFILLLPVPGQKAGASENGQLPVSCPENRPGCLLLQTIMQGYFDDFDPEDSLSVRIFSALLPNLCDLTEEDFIHTSQETGQKKEVLKERCCEALSNCLFADIRLQNLPFAHLSPERQILLPFLDPDSFPDAEYQTEEIRKKILPETIKAISGTLSLPVDYVKWLIYTDHSGKTASFPD